MHLTTLVNLTTTYIVDLLVTQSFLFIQFSDKIQLYSGPSEQPDVEPSVTKLSLVVIGPLDSDRKSNTGVVDV